MSSPLRNPKALTDWLELDYFRRERRLRRFRRWVTWGVFGAAAVAAVLLAFGARPLIYQAGPVSQAHTMFNHDCSVCHVQAFQTAKRLWPASASFHSVTDAACTSCHAGPDHHESVRATGCAGCHQEHRGRQFLSQVPDSHCTTCHAHLEPHPVRSFAAGDHPEFRLWQDAESDPSRVRFNHALHLRGEGLLTPGGTREQLECAQCHELDRERRYMQPIDYSAHCARCHPLSVQVVGNLKDPGARAAAAHFGAKPAPHEAPAVVRKELSARYHEFFQSFPVETESLRKRQVPGLVPRPPARPTQADWVAGQYRIAERLLFASGGSCRTCHVEKAGTSWQAGQLPLYEETSIPDRWLTRSRFSHDRHRLLRCSECHPAAAASQSAKDVLLPRIDVCQTCHNAQVGARSDCSECHAYHDRSKEISWAGTRTIHDCLRRR